MADAVVEVGMEVVVVKGAKVDEGVGVGDREAVEDAEVGAGVVVVGAGDESPPYTQVPSEGSGI